MMNDNDIVNKVESLYSFYGKGDVLLNIERIGGKDKEILLSYLGLNGQKAKTVSEIADMYGSTTLTIYKTIDKSLKLLSRMLEYPEIDVGELKYNKFISVHKLFERYGKENVMSKIKGLHQEERKMVVSFYRLQKNNENDNQEIKHKVVSRIMKSIIDELETESRNRREENNLIMKKLRNRYGRGELIGFVEGLRSKDKTIMLMYFGLVDNVPKSEEEISKLTDISLYMVEFIIEKNIRILDETSYNKDTLNKMNFVNRNNLNDVYKKYGLKRVEQSLNELEKKEKEIIEMYYGLKERNVLCDEEIAKILNIEYEVLFDTIDKIMSKIQKKLKATPYEEIVINKKYNELCEVFGKKNVEETINCSTIRYKSVILSFFGINSRFKSIDELKKEYSISVNKLYEIISKCISDISSIMLDDVPKDIKQIFKKYKKDKMNKFIGVIRKLNANGGDFIGCYKKMDLENRKKMIDKLDGKIMELETNDKFKR